MKEEMEPKACVKQEEVDSQISEVFNGLLLSFKTSLLWEIVTNSSGTLSILPFTFPDCDLFFSRK